MGKTWDEAMWRRFFEDMTLVDRQLWYYESFTCAIDEYGNSGPIWPIVSVEDCVNAELKEHPSQP